MQNLAFTHASCIPDNLFSVLPCVVLDRGDSSDMSDRSGPSSVPNDGGSRAISFAEGKRASKARSQRSESSDDRKNASLSKSIGQPAWRERSTPW